VFPGIALKDRRSQVYRCARNMSTIAINPSQQRLLDAINRRLDELDTAVTPAVAGIIAASAHLPHADRIYVKRRQMALGAPDTDWASTLSDDC
jgi:hypothetical protein